MKRLLMLNKKISACNFGKFTNNSIYEVIDDCIYIPSNKEDEEGQYLEATSTILNKFTNRQNYPRYIEILDDDKKKRTLEIEYNNDLTREFIIFDNDRDLARKLIDIIDGLDSTIINMALLLQNRE
jgi:disulfide oxidoreductase YuzD